MVCLIQEHYLPYLIRAKLKLILTGVNEQALVDFLDNAFKDLEHPERRRFLEVRSNRFTTVYVSLAGLINQGYNILSLLLITFFCCIKNRFSEELALLSIVQSDYDRATYHQSACIDQFLDNWSSLSNLAVARRRSRLANLQKFVEMGEFLNTVKKTGLGFKTSSVDVVSFWNRSSLDSMTDVAVLTDIAANRYL